MNTSDFAYLCATSSVPANVSNISLAQQQQQEQQQQHPLNECGGVAASPYPRLIAFYDLFRLVHGYVSASICIFGFGNNVINSIVLTRRAMRTAANQLLLGIAVCDAAISFSYLVYTVYLNIVTEPSGCGATRHRFIAILLILIHNSLIVTAHATSTMIVLALATYRCWTLYSREARRGTARFTLRHARLALAVSCGLSVTLLIPSYMSRQIVTVRLGAPHTAYWFAANKRWPWLTQFTYLFYGCFVKILSSVLLSVLTVAILVELHRNRRRRRRMRHNMRTNTNAPVATANAADNIAAAGTENQRGIETRRSELPLLALARQTPACHTRHSCTNETATPVTAPLPPRDAPQSDELHSRCANCASRAANCSKVVLNAACNHVLVRYRKMISSERQGASQDASGATNTTNTAAATTTTTSSMESYRTSIMLVVVLINFVSTEFPQGVLNTMAALDQCFRIHVYNQIGDVMDLLVLISSSVNFILYCSMSKQFRVTFRQLLFRRIYRVHSSTQRR